MDIRKLIITIVGAAAIMLGAAGILPSSVTEGQGNGTTVERGILGSAIVSWDAVPDATHYRVGWINMKEYREWYESDAGGDSWLDLFAFHDVVAAGETTHTIRNLNPNDEYGFITAPLGSRFGEAHFWSQWAFLPALLTISLSDYRESRQYALTVTGTGFLPHFGGYLYVWANPDTDPKSCKDVQLWGTRWAEGFVDGFADIDGEISLTREVLVPIFQPGDRNFLCLTDGVGRYSDVVSFNLAPTIWALTTCISPGDVPSINFWDAPTAAPHSVRLYGGDNPLDSPLLLDFDFLGTWGDGTGRARIYIPDDARGFYRLVVYWDTEQASRRIFVGDNICY